MAAGIGLNVNWPDGLPEDLADIAVALNHVCGHRIDRDTVLDVLLDRLELHYGDVVAGAGSSVLDAWRARSATLGRRVRVDLGRDDVVGVATDITADGHLVVDGDDGRRRTLAVGDVVHLRTAD